MKFVQSSLLWHSIARADAARRHNLTNFTREFVNFHAIFASLFELFLQKKNSASTIERDNNEAVN